LVTVGRYILQFRCRAQRPEYRNPGGPQQYATGGVEGASGRGSSARRRGRGLHSGNACTDRASDGRGQGIGRHRVLSAPLFSFNRRIVIERCAALRLPAIYEWPEMAEEGGLIGYGPRLTLIYGQLSRLIVKVLRGVTPEDLPVEQPTKFELVINLKTAKVLDLNVPLHLQELADEAIE
jgi:ABC transporter substrate binding protein